MSLSASAIRQRAQAAIEALYTTQTPWKHSYQISDSFPADPQKHGHLAFCVDLPLSSYTGQDMSPKRRPDGVWMEEALRVRFLFRLQVDNQVASYDLALDKEEELRRAVLGASQLGGVHWLLQLARRTVTASGEFFLCDHQYLVKYLQNI